eukprot:TRINITY_DN22468_c0_g1_i1.p1 TRINITY_DN22468_c0_g1~~TRINITY_DN22468_c0_g1_i1.p1  ORF type:complete len:400 (+),score=137.33 TRINITY_DN22468_c0_g1_i1:162-1361(+)
MKLPIVLALLSLTMAFGAPRSTFEETDAIVPEDILVQSSSPMGALQSEFDELRTTVEAGKTKGVKATIDKLVAMVAKKIVPAIKEAHAADQRTLNTMMKSIAGRNNAMVEADKVLQTRANQVRTLIRKANSASKQWGGSASTFTLEENHYIKTQGQKVSTCCDRDHAGVLDLMSTPPAVVCDYKHQDTSAGCADRALAAVAAIVDKPFDKGLKLYRSLRSKCSALNKEMKRSDKRTDSARNTCQRNKVDALAASTLASSQRVGVQSEWDKTVKDYNRDFTSMLLKYTAREAQVKTDAKDRLDEYSASQVIMCILKSYKDGGKMDEATEKKCRAKVKKSGVVDMKYPRHIKRLKPSLAPFHKQVDRSSYQNTCTTRKIPDAFTCPSKAPKPVATCSPGPK